jgi:regulator of protease activity HflC (stomatin/prohibitin superfamily)
MHAATRNTAGQATNGRHQYPRMARVYVLPFLGLTTGIAVFAAYGSLFTVHQTRQALVVRFGEPVQVITEPGLHVKWPFIDTVITVDNRILSRSSGESTPH